MSKQRAVFIDAAGKFIADIPGDPEYVGAPGTAPAWDVAPIDPRWNGAQWIEGAAPDVVAAVAAQAKATGERAWRNAELQRADIRVADALDRQQLDRYHAWCEYRIALRDMPAQSADPFAWKRPEAPKQ
jgi:hypothetical protein